MKISAREAADYFRHPSQQIFGLDPDFLPDAGFHYHADGHLCGVFHLGPYPDVYFGHYGMRPEGRGVSVEAGKRILREFAAQSGAVAIVGWTDTDNRAALAFNRRMKFENRGEIAPGITEQVWRPSWR